MDWIIKIEKYFDNENIVDEKKVKIASTKLKIMHPCGGRIYNEIERNEEKIKSRYGIIW